MYDFFDALSYKIEKIYNKYKDKPAYAALKLALWCFVSVFVKRKKKVSISIDKNRINLFFHLAGGIGDIVIAANYIKELYLKIGFPTSIYISYDQKTENVKSIFYGYDFIRGFYCLREKNINIDILASKCDARIDIVRFPKVIFWNKKKIMSCSKFLTELLCKYKSFEDNNKKFFCFGSELDTLRVIYSLINGHTRRTQTDLCHILQMNEKTFPFMKIDETAFMIIKEYNITKPFITIQRGVDVTFDGTTNTRLWPEKYYNILIKMIKDEFPNLLVVQVGALSAYSNFENVDVDLRGKTNFEQLKAVLKQSLLHIDGECGMVHIKHALNGISAVFFGQTRIDFCGYPENINVCANDACPAWCEWVTDDWMKKCCQGKSNSPCMEQIYPNLFFSKIKPYIKKALLKKELWEDVDTFDVEENIISFSQCNNDGQKCFQNYISENINSNTGVCFGDILNIPLDDESINAVIWNENNVSKEFHCYAFSECYRVLKPKGLLKMNNKILRKI